jgi:DNA-directed RNA polymerase subunit RPC12/RpoP
MPINTFKCPNCGSTVTTTGAEKEVQCAYCGSTVIVPEELRDAPQPQPMEINFGQTSQPNDQVFQTMETAGKVAAGATIGFTAVSFILPIILTCVILAAVAGILFYVFSNVNSALNQSNQTASTMSAPINEVPTATSAPTPTEAIPTPVPFTKALFKDDFSSSSSGLPRDRNSKYTLEYKNGKYHVLINEQGKGQEVTMDSRGSYTDVSVEADIQQTAGPSDGLMGVTCRDDNNGNFYSFEFSQNGTYGIYKYSNGSADSLDEETMDPNTVNQNDVNHIEGVCSGDTLTLLLNGQVLSQVQDSDYPKGAVGLAVRTGSSGDPGVDVLFSNFVVKGS